MKLRYLALGGIGSTLSLAGRTKAPDDTGKDFEPAVTALAEALGTAERVEIFEGLPNPSGERDSFAEEKRAKGCREIAGEWFYAKPQEARLADILELQRLTAGGFFRPRQGLKLCGGFHADYALALIDGKNTHYVFFCLGCHEAKIIGETQPFAAGLFPDDFRLTTDLKPEFFDSWRARLTAYRKERPALVGLPSGR